MKHRVGQAASFLLLISGLSWHLASYALAPDWGSMVYKVRVVRNDGVLEFGSSVPVDGAHVVTNCHVLRDASQIQVMVNDKPRVAILDRGDTYRDLCFLKVAGQSLDPPYRLQPPQIQVGLEVVAVGYQGGKLDISRGHILALYTCHCRGGDVIQTSATFDRGASGGGLFDLNGRLVGILTFKARAGGDFYFALPTGWFTEVASDVSVSSEGGDSFWEQPNGENEFFLHACDLAARRQWQSLEPFAHQWVIQEPNNPEAWMMLGRSERALGKEVAAVASYKHVLALDPTRSEALDALGELETGEEPAVARSNGMLGSPNQRSHCDRTTQ